MSRPATASVRLLSGEREPVRLATTGNITLAGLQVIDGVATEVNDRILVKDQTDGRQNGIWTASTGRWFRASDAAFPRAIDEGVTVHVQEGTANASKVYRFDTPNPRIGVDSIAINFYLSATLSGDVGTAVELSQTAAATAVQARDDVVAASDIAVNAAGTATTAASNASGSAGTASGAASTASTSAGQAMGFRNSAERWAQAPIDEIINDGVNPSGKSAYHWAKIAEQSVGGGDGVNAARLGGENPDYYTKLANMTDQLSTDQLPTGFQGFVPDASVLAQAKTMNVFWKDVHPTVKIHRINDRVLVGAAADNSGNLSGTQGDWLTTAARQGRPTFSTTGNSQVAVLSTIGEIAFTAASRTSDGPGPSLGCIPVAAFAFNDAVPGNGVSTQTAYGMYIEAWRQPGAGNTHGYEMDVMNLGSLVNLQPYDMYKEGLTVGSWVCSGGELTTDNPASAAYCIVNNGSKWNKGIIFGANALQGTDGVTGNGVAIEMAKGHAIRQIFTGGGLGSSIAFNVSGAGAQQQLQFADTGLLYVNAGAYPMFQVKMNSDHRNGLAVQAAASGFGPTLVPEGADANIDLSLAGKGGGRVNFTNTSVAQNASSQFGYLIVKINGTERKIPVYNI